ncbi:hypothetical protein WJX81_000328 [Elliptochloris bilobata]|uniref:Uncharacterized protein n=1 Tax=Elliptochloris bilobata TaxID=381761 RepID=A0AAW1RM40_9CHLO
MVARMGAAAETFRSIYSNLPEHARLDRARLAEDLCDGLIHLLRLASVCSADVAAKWDERLAVNGAVPPESEKPAHDTTGGDEARAPKRLRFTDVQRAALEALGERSSWSLPSLSREEKEAFSLQHNISKALPALAASRNVL